MVGGEQENQAYACQGLKKDRISQLPDPLICQILCHLPIVDSVKTNVLSTRWRGLWLWLPRLELSLHKIPDFNAFTSVGDMFLDPNRVSCIENLKVDIESDASYLTSWIDAAVKRKVKHLDLWCRLRDDAFEVPTSIYTCETLVTLKLKLADLDDAKLFSLPRLKILHLRGVWYPTEATFERLVASCPVLEELVIVACVDNTEMLFRVFSTSLKKLEIAIQESGYSLCSGVVIDAPLLSFLSINGLSRSLVINKMHPSAKLVICGGFALNGHNKARQTPKRDSTRSFLWQMSEIKDMTISEETVKVIFQYLILSVPLPRFGCMSRLHATICHSDLKRFLTFLTSCPNLKSLILECYREVPLDMKQIRLSSIPECFLSSLEFIDLEFRGRGYVSQLKIVKYFLENTAILKKLTLRFPCYSIRETSMLKVLLRKTVSSSKYDAVVLDWYSEPDL